MQRLTFNMIGTREPVSALDPEDVRERMSNVGYLDPSFILRTDNTVVVSVDKNVYNISTNLEFKFLKTYVVDNNIELPSKNYGIQEILVNMETSNDSPAFGEIDEYNVSGQTIDIGTNIYDTKIAYVKYLTEKS